MDPAEAFLKRVGDLATEQARTPYGGTDVRLLWQDLVKASDCKDYAGSQQTQPGWRVELMSRLLHNWGWHLQPGAPMLSRVFGYTQRVAWFGETELKKQDGTTPTNVSLLMFRRDGLYDGHGTVISTQDGVRVGGCAHGMLMRLDDDAPVFREFRWMKPDRKGEPDYYVPRGNVAFAAIQKIVLPNEPYPVWKMEELPQPAPAYA